MKLLAIATAHTLTKNEAKEMTDAVVSTNSNDSGVCLVLLLFLYLQEAKDQPTVLHQTC